MHTANPTVPTPLILIAEDDSALARLFARALETQGFRTEVVFDGKAALAWLAVERPDVAILDILMPEVDGRDVLCHMQNDPRLVDVPVIMVSGRDDEYTREDVLSMGARDLLGKPTSPGEIVSRVRRVLDG